MGGKPGKLLYKADFQELASWNQTKGKVNGTFEKAFTSIETYANTGKATKSVCSWDEKEMKGKQRRL